MAKSNNKRKRFPFIAVLLIVVACGVFAYSAYRLIDFYREDEVAEQQAQELFELAVSTVPPSGEATPQPFTEAATEATDNTPAPTEGAAATPAVDDTEAAQTEAELTSGRPSAQPTQQASQTAEPGATQAPAPTQGNGGGDYTPPTAGPLYVDFDSLHGINPDICAWIYSQGTPINYPVVTTSDASYYLTHLVDGTYSKAGSLFVDVRNSYGFTDLNTIIYGHNMKSGRMFGTLKYYKTASYYSGHQYMWLYTPEAVYRLDVIAGYVTRSGSEAYTVYSDTASLHAYLQEAAAKSSFATAVDISAVERVVTLSTCSYEFSYARFVVVCSLVRVA